MTWSLTTRIFEASPRIRFASAFDFDSLHEAAGRKGIGGVGNVQLVAILADVTGVRVGVQEDSAVAAFRGFEFQREFVILVGIFVNE